MVCTFPIGKMAIVDLCIVLEWWLYIKEIIYTLRIFPTFYTIFITVTSVEEITNISIAMANYITSSCLELEADNSKKLRYK